MARDLLIWTCFLGAGLLIIVEVVVYIRVNFRSAKAIETTSEKIDKATTILIENTATTNERAEAVVAEATNVAKNATAQLDSIVKALEVVGAKAPLLVGAILLLLIGLVFGGGVQVDASVNTTPNTVTNEIPPTDQDQESE